MKIADGHRSCLRNLKRDFVAFRRRYPPHTRVPDELRRAVLEAVRLGIDPSLLKVIAGVTGAQVAKWRQYASPVQMVSLGSDACPRVLEVVPAVAGAGLPTGLRVSYEAGRLLLELSL